MGAARVHVHVCACVTWLFEQILKGTAQWALCCFVMHSKVSEYWFRDDSIVQSVLMASLYSLPQIRFAGGVIASFCRPHLQPENMFS